MVQNRAPHHTKSAKMRSNWCENDTKMVPTWTQMGSLVPWGVFWEALGGLGGSGMPLRPALGALGVLLGASCGLLGVSWGHFWSPWGRIGSFLGTLGGPWHSFGSQKACPKPLFCENADHEQTLVYTAFAPHYGLQGGPSWALGGSWAPAVGTWGDLGGT